MLNKIIFSSLIFFCSSPCFAYYVRGNYRPTEGYHYNGPPEYKLPLAIVSIILALGIPIGLAIWVNRGKKPTNKKIGESEYQKYSKNITDNIDPSKISDSNTSNVKNTFSFIGGAIIMFAILGFLIYLA